LPYFLITPPQKRDVSKTPIIGATFSTTPIVTLS
jgi:hypothetical protein